MPKVVTEFPSDRGPDRVEVKAPEGQGPAARVGRGRDVGETASQSFEEAVAGIRPIAEGSLAQTTGLVRAPRSVEVCFGIKLSGEAGVIPAFSTAEGQRCSLAIPI